MPSFVEYETVADLQAAVEKLDNREFKGSAVRCVADVSTTSLRFDIRAGANAKVAFDDLRLLWRYLRLILVKL